MPGPLPRPRYRPCAVCGASVDTQSPEPHECESERALDFYLLELRDEIAAFDAQLAAWLATAAGRFATWIAERDRLGGEASGPAAS
jgi:hypothetical protein